MLTFTSTIHDPENRLGYLIEEVGESLRNLFDSATVAYTPRTHPDIIKLLVKNRYRVNKAGDSVISTYQSALKQTLDHGPNSIFYSDLDRALHWMKSYPAEFKQIAQSPPNHDFVLIGRTKRAFDTHPETQTLTEGIGNVVASKVLRFKKTGDILGTTWILTPQQVKMILEHKPMSEFGFYTEWPMKLWRSARNPLYIEREGLEWETPDRYQDEIKNQGLETWKQSFQTVNEWKRRTNMLKDFIETMAVE